MKSIFLVNPISGRGHLDAYARLYSRALVELGYRVVLVAETDADAPGYLARSGIISGSAFSYISFAEASASKAWKPKPPATADEPPPGQPSETEEAASAELHARMNLSAAEKARLVWQEEGFEGLLRRLVFFSQRGSRAFILQPARSARNRIKQEIFRLRREIYHRVSQIPAPHALRRYLYPDSGRVLFQTMIYYVRGARLALDEAPPDLVLFLYLDLMGQAPSNIAALDAPDSAPWAGILFHPRLAKSLQARVEPYFESKNARGAIFLVPPAIDTYAGIAPHLKFILAPDAADLELSVELPGTAREIQKRAAGRKIVLQVGSIALHKGITTLLDVITKADPNRFFFALVGEVHWHTFRSDQQRLRAFYAQPPENVYIHEGYLKEERDYNALIAACDVIYAVYNGFNSSSNSLTKAAGLQRPILVTNGTLMGKRVLASGIGLVATEGDPDDILLQLNNLVTRSPDSFGFDRYIAEHSIDNLKSVLAEALPRWFKDPVARSRNGPNAFGDPHKIRNYNITSRSDS